MPKRQLNEEMVNNLMYNLKYEECYAYLAGLRILFLTENITKSLSFTLTAMLLNYDNINNEDIYIYINSNGGDSSALVNIYDVMQMIKSPINTICIGKAYSAAAFILAAGTKGKRFITKNANVMIHGIQCVFPQDPLSDQKDSEIYINFLNSYDKNIMNIMAKHTNKSLEKILKDSNRDFYLNSNEAVKYGLVDKII